MQIPNTFNRMGISADGGGGGGGGDMPTSGLVFYAPFDIDYDEKIHNITPTVTGSSYISISSAQGLTFYKNDANSWREAYLTYGNSTQYLQQGTGNFTVSFWLKQNTSSWPGSQTIICNTQTGDPYTGISIYADGWNSGIDARLGGENNFFSNTSVYADDGWHFWLLVKDGDNMNWYYDGVLDSTQSGNADKSFSATSDLMISNANNWYTSKGNFCLRRFRIYDRALSYDEIQTLNTENKPEMPTSGLVFYAPLSSATDQYANTGQALSYNGTPTSAVIDGVQCLNCNNTIITTTQLDGFPIGNDSFTFSVWCKLVNVNGNYSLLVLGSNRSYDYAHIGVQRK